MQRIAKPLLVWFDKHGRHNLPWQSNPANVYYVWLSEIMLQQTQVETVLGYFNNFIRHFPTLSTLAHANDDQVLAQWAGLGYYARAHNLHKTAQIVMATYQGNFPTEFADVIQLPGIGKSTAGAILALGFNQNHTILDGNVKRILSRYHQVKGHYGQSATLKTLWHLAQTHTPNKRTADYTQAIMDLGATLCTPVHPQCVICPINTYCQANKHNTQAQYPNPNLKKNKPTKKVAMLIFINKNREVYLQKRPNKGIWGGLWSFIECEDNQKTISQTVRAFSTKAHIDKALTPIKHSFTHYHLHINPIIINCNNKTKNFWTPHALNIGTPAPVSKILSQLD